VPIGFPSLSHGEIAFGFFNIETDLLILENYFFFAPSFCGIVTQVAETPGLHRADYSLPGYIIEDRNDVGNLMGAIHGTDLRGFIGSVYRLFPFPQRVEEFKQNPYGEIHRSTVEELISHWARPRTVPVNIEAELFQVRIADYLFSRAVFQRLVGYVLQGGMPGWKGGTRPEYVEAMERAIKATGSPLLQGLELSASRVQASDE
jgi:hypothetical protein